MSSFYRIYALMPIGTRSVLLATLLFWGIRHATAAEPPSGAPASSTALTPHQAREDLELAIDAAEAALPNLYWHQTPHAWRQATAVARERAKQVTDSDGLWLILRPLMSQIGEGHLGLKISDAIRQRDRDRPRFPLDVLWTTSGVFVLQGYGDAARVPRGARLTAIDGEDMATLFRELFVFGSHDGEIPTGVMRDASDRGLAGMLLRLRGPRTRFDIAWKFKGTRDQGNFPAVERSARPPEADDPSPAPTLEWLDADTAYLNVPTFSNRRLRKQGLTFTSVIQDVFTQLQTRHARNLILDLRQNGGGSEPNEAILFSYLVDHPLRRYAFVQARKQNIAIQSASGQRFETTVFDDDEIKQQTRLSDGRLMRRNEPPEGLMTRWTRYGPVYHGKLVILAGGNTFSGGAELSSMLAHVQRGVFVGEEVAGTHEGNTSGHRWAIDLPNSGMTLTMPLLQFRMAWPGLPHDRGVRPQCDVPPNPDEADVVRDRAWRVAAEVLRQPWHSPAQATCPLHTE